MSTQLKSEMNWIKARTKEKAYFNSEHIVRYLTQKLFSIKDIETVLLDGKILETHRHPLRCDSYLFLGDSNGRHIHVMCTKDNEANLIILYAYHPCKPAWKDEKTRMQTEAQPMGKTLKKCFFCNGEIEPIYVGNFDFRWEGGLYVIKGVPAGLCVQCGEKYISAQDSKKIVARIENQDVIAKDEVLVFEYEK